jgi:hypothetical protein
MLFQARSIARGRTGRLAAFAFVLAAIIAGSRAQALETITLSPSGLPSGVQGQFYNQPILANDGDNEDQNPSSTDSDDVFTYAVTSGSLPPGLSLGAGPTAGGVPLSGTPTAAGTYTFTITATSGDTSSGSQPYTLIIAAAARHQPGEPSAGEPERRLQPDGHGERRHRALHLHRPLGRVANGPFA